MLYSNEIFRSLFQKEANRLQLSTVVKVCSNVARSPGEERHAALQTIQTITFKEAVKLDFDCFMV